MTDLELLKRAAQAARIQYEWHHGCGDALHLTSPDATAIYWNPLRNDSDAFVLAATLRLTVYHDDLAVIVKHKRYSWEWLGEVVNEDKGDRVAATRRAIVRAAAAMCDNYTEESHEAGNRN